MDVVRSPSDMLARTKRWRAEGETVALVPTMGFLHEAHLSLVRIARARADVVVVSIFVNPTQFGAGEDFEDYPRDLERDLEACRSDSVDVVFHPDADAMYASDHSVVVRETALSRDLCGRSRPGHFEGVTTVVAKLFNIVQPTLAVFGAKDAQQARVIQQMVSDLNFPVEIVVGPILREPDGLAMSSRNTLLTDAERADAVRIREALLLTRELAAAGETRADVLRDRVMAHINAASTLETDYVEIVDWDRFRPVTAVDERTLIAVAVRVGKTRLIDNIMPASDAFPGF